MAYCIAIATGVLAYRVIYSSKSPLYIGETRNLLFGKVQQRADMTSFFGDRIGAL
jgi:hypothetical protein